METIGERLRKARVAAGYESAAAAAAAFGWHPQNVRDNEADRRGVSADRARDYARAYGVEPTWILYGGANPKAKSAPRAIPIKGLVGADPEGRVLYSTGDEQGDMVLVGPGVAEDSVALEVRGHSMRGFADDGSLIFFREQYSRPTRDMLGRVVVCQLVGGEVVVKRLVKGDGPGVYDLESIVGTTLEDAKIVWVALVTTIVLPDEAKRLIMRGGVVAA